MNADAVRASYDAADPITWRRAVADARALDIADAAARHGREAVRIALGHADVSGVDKLIRAAKDTRTDPARLALALAIRPALLRAALINAAPGWHVDPPSGLVYRLYDADGQELADETAAVYRRAAFVDLGRFCWGVARVDLAGRQGRVVHGMCDDPAEAIRAVLAEPFTSAPTETLPPVR